MLDPAPNYYDILGVKSTAPLDEIRRRYKDQITNAASGMTLAVQYRLDRLPAIVINRAKVIYGVADVDRAIELFAAAQQRPSR